MSTFGTSEFEVLIETVTTSLPCIEQALMRLEISPLDTEALEGTYHHLHTIGRAASMAKWPMLAYLAHGAEGVLADIMDGFGRLDASTLDLLSHSLATMNQLLQQLDIADQQVHSWPPSSSGTRQTEAVVETFITHTSQEQSRAAGDSAKSFTSHMTPEQLAASEAELRRERDGREPYRERGYNSARFGRPPITIRQQEQKVERAITLISTLQRQRSSGVLFLKRGGGANSEEGTIRFTEGKIANAQVGRRSGAEARNWLSTWTNCRFTFQPASSTTEPGK